MQLSAIKNHRSSKFDNLSMQITSHFAGFVTKNNSRTKAGHNLRVNLGKVQRKRRCHPSASSLVQWSLGDLELISALLLSKIEGPIGLGDQLIGAEVGHGRFS